MSNSVNTTYYTLCPAGFVIPSEPLNSNILWVTGTNCAQSCLSPRYTTNEWKDFTLISIIIPAIALPVALFSVLSWFVDKNRLKKYLVLCFSLPHAIACLWFVVVSSYPIDERSCSSNAVPVTNEDGATICAIESIIGLYCLFSGSIAWCIQAVDLFFKIVMGRKESYHHIYLAIIILLPLIPVLYLGISKNYGFNRELPYCLVSSKGSESLDIALYYLPMLISTFIGTCFMIPVLQTITKTTLKVSNLSKVNGTGSNFLSTLSGSSKVVPLGTFNSPSKLPIDKLNHSPIKSPVEGGSALQSPSSFASPRFNGSNIDSPTQKASLKKFQISNMKIQKNYKVLATTSSFLLLYLALWIPWFCYRGIQYTSRDNINQSLETWIQCVFTYYDGISDSSWNTICGSHPSTRLSISFTCYSIIAYLGQSLLVSAIFFSFENVKKTYKIVYTWFMKTFFNVTVNIDKSQAGLSSRGRSSKMSRSLFSSRALSDYL